MFNAIMHKASIVFGKATLPTIAEYYVVEDLGCTLFAKEKYEPALVETHQIKR